jgi:hypothetical protein
MIRGRTGGRITALQISPDRVCLAMQRDSSPTD